MPSLGNFTHAWPKRTPRFNPLTVQSRKWLERAMHLAVLAILSFVLWIVFASGSGLRPASTESDADGLASRIVAWSTSPAPDSIALTLDTAPDVRHRAWLSALRRAGSVVSWSGEVPALALEIERIADPTGGARVRVAAPHGAWIIARDAFAAADSARAGAAGAEFMLPAASGEIVVETLEQPARAMTPDKRTLRRVLVVGRASWESRFIITALEERGWDVDATLHVAPAVAVSQGSQRTPDSARHAAVIAVDTTAARLSSRIARYVRDGGGLVLAGNAADAPGLASLAPGETGERLSAASISFAVSSPRRALGFVPLAEVRRNAVVLESRGGRVASAAWRVGAGRVVYVGYDESWRWRMTGGEEGADSHLAWWAAVVSSAAAPSEASLADTNATSRVAGDAPLASLVQALGEATPRKPAIASAHLPPRLRPWMLASILLLLLTEWTSRRLRGAR